jgi:hypothetical protein
MSKVIASVAVGSVVVVLVFLAVTFLEIHWGIGKDVGVVRL